MPLQPIEDITQLSPRVVRVLGQNPGQFTLQGTNCYLVGERSPFILIDTGEGKPAWIPLLNSCLGDGGSISDIILTHRHKDHVRGLPDVLEMLEGRGAPVPKIWKRRDEEPDADIERMVEGLNYEPAQGGSALHALANGQVIAAPGSSLRVVHTPGHTSDSISLLVEEDRSIFSGDTILGEGTTVFSSLSTYLASLHRLLSLSPTIIYPAHGPVLPDGQGAIRTYISHRQARERQIVEVLSRPRTIQDDQHVPGEWETGERIGYSTEDITSIVYPDVSVVIKVAAARGVDQHLAKLEDEGKVHRILNSVATGPRWVLASASPP